MKATVPALGLDPAFVDLGDSPKLAPDVVRAFLDAQVERVRSLGHEVRACLVAPDETADAIVARHLRETRFDCVLFGAGLRAPEHLLLFERLLNLVHAQAPAAKLCFNSSPSDSAEAVQRWV